LLITTNHITIDFFSFKITSWFLLFILSSINCYTQSQATFQNYNISNGLPSHTIYDVVQDTSGFIWLATDVGIARFDGQVFRTYNIKDSLTDIEILDLFIDSKQRLWCNAYNGKIFYLQNGKVYSENNSPLLAQYPKAFWRHITESNDGTIHLYFKKLILTNIKSGQISEIENSTEIKVGSSYHINSNTYLWDENWVYQLQQKTLVKKLAINKIGKDVDISKVYEIENKLWVTTLNKGVFQIDEKSSKILNHLKDEAVPSILQDAKNNIWLGAFRKGLYRLNESKDLVYNQLNGLVHDEVYTFQINANKLFLGDESNNVHLIDNQQIASHKILNQDKEIFNKVRFIHKIDNERIIVGSDISLAIFNTQTRKWNNLYVGGLKDILQLESKYLITSSTGFFLYQESLPPELVELNIPNVNPTCLTIDNMNRIWVGKLNGLSYFLDDDFEVLHNYNALGGKRINDIDSNGGKTCVCTANNGLYIIEADSVRQVNFQSGLLSDNCNSVYVDNENNIWYATNQGLNLITTKNNQAIINGTYNNNTGLISNRIQKVEFHDDKIYLGTDKGLQIIAKQDFFKSKKNKVYLDEIKVNNESIDWSNGDIKLKNNHNNLQFSFSEINYSSTSSYKYKLEGFDENWQVTHSNNLEYFNLNPGIYNFLLKDASSDSETPISIKIDIAFNYWQTNWFRFIICICVLLASYLLYKWRLGIQSRRLELKRLKASAELKALRSQINPHFLFNALNSIQDVVLSEDIDKANNYISRFSRLMRITLEQSKSPLISVAEEIKSLEIYLELESLRFENKFESQFVVDNKIYPEDIYIPSFILQPLVENAIWHGLLRKNDDAKLRIEFIDNGEHLLCAVDDDGLGYGTNTNKNSLHKSTALVNLNERITLINEELSNNISFVILKSRFGNSEFPGTRIELSIPYELSKINII